ncbi:MAG TPA: hypothetical protein VN132_06085, partial [Bdellovibrio sp.]|nr:hypothetical protein [Bdellovibrio sp.]
AFQYAGSTMDFTALYRLIASLELFQKENLSVEKIHSWIQQQQQFFLSELDLQNHPLVNRRTLLVSDLNNHGHFLTFDLPSVDETQRMVNHLKSREVLVDSRGTRLRFGFGLYHDQSQIKKAVASLSSR